jgi:hypothetical protein
MPPAAVWAGRGGYLANAGLEHSWAMSYFRTNRHHTPHRDERQHRKAVKVVKDKLGAGAVSAPKGDQTGKYTLNGVVTSLKEEHENFASRIFSNDRDCLAPHVHSRRAKGSVRPCRNEMTLDAESVVGGCVS